MSTHLNVHLHFLQMYSIWIHLDIHIEVHLCTRPVLYANAHMRTDSTISFPFTTAALHRYFLVDGASVDDRPVWCKPAVQMKALGSRATDVYLIYCSLATRLNKGDSFMGISRYHVGLMLVD